MVMITQYITKAMQKATYELLEDGTFYSILDLPSSLWPYSAFYTMIPREP